jgi:hypothetical protein
LKIDETNAVPILFDNLKKNNLDLIALSQPNANLQEHLVLFEYIKRLVPVKILILPLVFDDTREDGLRSGISDLLSDKDLFGDLNGTDIGRKLIKKNYLNNNNSDTAGISETIQEIVESNINKWLEEKSTLWASRPEIRGQIMTNLHILRNSIFGIKPGTKRKIIKSRYLDNFTALESILLSASTNGIKVLVYVVPLRNDVDVPYVEAEYSMYKSEVQN